MSSPNELKMSGLVIFCGELKLSRLVIFIVTYLPVDLFRVKDGSSSEVSEMTGPGQFDTSYQRLVGSVKLTGRSV